MTWARILFAWLAATGAGYSADWTLTRSEHFEVYSDSSPRAARDSAEWLERLRTFFVQQGGERLGRRGALRLVGFQSAAEYGEYRLHAGADAYYTGTESRDYVVMPLKQAGAAELRVLAHEYAHALMHAGATADRERWPGWLAEGFSEFVSTVRISGGDVSLGGDLPAHTQLLQRRGGGAGASAGTPLFYARSWAMVQMLVVKPEYATKLPAFLSRVGDGVESGAAFRETYGKSPEDVERDLWRFVIGPKGRVSIASGEGTLPQGAIVQRPVSEDAARGVLAELLLANGDLARAEKLYRDLLERDPGNADLAGSLGLIALGRRELGEARRLWNGAAERVGDAALCFRYAVLGDQAGVPQKEIRPVLERAVALNPGFDDARFLLAGISESLGDPEAAVEQYRAMRVVTGKRAFGYWTSLANALNELGRNEEASAAVERATECAGTVEERRRAEQMGYLARTEFTVQMMTGADGRVRAVGARKPRESQDWNPFVEPGEEVRRVEGKLVEVACGEDGLRVRVEVGERQVGLRIPDPARVLMRNAPGELICGEQRGEMVSVDYVGTQVEGGVVRGIAFR